VGYTPKEIIQTTRLGIPKGRDEHLPYRFIDAAFVAYCSKKA
jgi:DNA-3-methyladenine glycosylase